jgi:glutamate transport system permease protein
VIGYQELLFKGLEVARTPRFGLPYIPVAIVVGLVYVGLCAILSSIAHLVERRTGVRAKPPTAFSETVATEPIPADAVVPDA